MRSSIHVALLALWGGSSRALTLVPLAPASARWSIATAPPRAAEARCKLGFKPKELVVGEKAEGIVSKITDYGCFVSLCGGQQLGLLHIRQLADGKRMLKNEVEDFVEETVGPVGSKVSVEVLQLEFKGLKRISLSLIEVIKKQRLEDVVFAPGPRRMQGVSRDGDGPGDPNARLDESVPF